MYPVMYIVLACGCIAGFILTNIRISQAAARGVGHETCLQLQVDKAMLARDNRVQGDRQQSTK